MFNDFAESDERVRTKRAFRRLCSLRAARLAGYFDEPVLERGEWPNEPPSQHEVLAAMSDDEFDAWLREQPGLAKAIDRLNAALSGSWWDYESDEGFKGMKV